MFEYASGIGSEKNPNFPILHNNFGARQRARKSRGRNALKARKRRGLFHSNFLLWRAAKRSSGEYKKAAKGSRRYRERLWRLSQQGVSQFFTRPARNAFAKF